MSREPIRIHRSFQTKKMSSLLLWEISRRFHRLCPRYGQVAHALRTLPPVAAKVLLPRAAPRLACVKPAASVHPEPGSNSSLYILILLSLIPDALYNNFVKKLTLSIYFLFSVLACTCSSNIFKELNPFRKSFFRNGLQRYELFPYLQTFFAFFLLFS